NIPRWVSSDYFISKLEWFPRNWRSTISFGAQTQGNCSWAVDEFSGINTSGTNGANAVVQSANVAINGGGAAITGVTITLSALANANSAAYGFLRAAWIGGGLTKGSAFTQLSQVSDATNHIYLESEWAINQTAVNWTWASSNGDYQGIEIEIAAAAVAVSTSFLSMASTISRFTIGSYKTIFLLSGTSFTTPSDWSSVNTVHAIGAGGGCGGGAGPGGGGAYAYASNIAAGTY